MRILKKRSTLIISALSLLMLILDARGAITGAREGVQLCIQTLIPSLFPFFVISGYFCGVFAGTRLAILQPILRLCQMPEGSDPLFIIGMLGGYPVGAQSIADAYRNGQIDSENAKRMLGFCSNAGPAFVFGIVGAYYETQYTPWVIWGILILSAILTGWLLPRTSNNNYIRRKQEKVNLLRVFQNSIIAIASVCGWVILFRVFISILKRWILWIFPEIVQIALTGFLELSNGCIELNRIVNDGTRFIISTGLLSFGGLCVYLQTKSVTENLGPGLYFPGKILQCSLALTFSSLIQYFLFPAQDRMSISVLLPPLFLVFIILLIFQIQIKKKTVAISRELMYNTGNYPKTREIYAVSKKDRTLLPLLQQSY